MVYLMWLVRWTWVVFFSVVAVISFVLAPFFGLLTLPLALIAWGFALWIGSGVDRPPSRSVISLLRGGAILMAELVALVVALTHLVD